MLAEDATPPTSRPLGQYLDVAPAPLAQALSRQSDGEHDRIGELLLDLGAIDVPGLRDGLRAQRVDRLRPCRLFAGLSDEELASTSEIFKEVTVASGEVFIREQQSDSFMFVLCCGRCEVFRGGGTQGEVSLARLDPGEPIGEMGYFAGGARTASVRALDTCQLLRATYDDLSAVFESEPTVAAAFMQIVTERLRDTNLLFQRNEFATADASTWPQGPARGLREAARTDELRSGIERLLRRIARTAARNTDASAAALFAVDEARHALVTLSSAGGGARRQRVPISNDARKWVIDNNRIANAAYAVEEPAPPPPDMDDPPQLDTTPTLVAAPGPMIPADSAAQTLLIAPVRGAKGRVIGLLEARDKRVGAFNESDELMLRALATQASVCIDNVESFRAVRADFERATDLLEVSALLLQANSFDDLMRWLPVTLERLLRCEQLELLRFDPDASLLWTWPANSTTATGELEGTRVEYGVAQTLGGEALMSGRAMRWANVSEDERFDPEFDVIAGLRTQSLLAVPVSRRDGETCALLQAVNGDRGHFVQRDETLLGQVADLLQLSEVVNR